MAPEPPGDDYPRRLSCLLAIVAVAGLVCRVAVGFQHARRWKFETHRTELDALFERIQEDPGRPRAERFSAPDIPRLGEHEPYAYLEVREGGAFCLSVPAWTLKGRPYGFARCSDQELTQQTHPLVVAKPSEDLPGGWKIVSYAW